MCVFVCFGGSLSLSREYKFKFRCLNKLYRAYTGSLPPSTPKSLPASLPLCLSPTPLAISPSPLHLSLPHFSFLLLSSFPTSTPPSPEPPPPPSLYHFPFPPLSTSLSLSTCSPLHLSVPLTPLSTLPLPFSHLLPSPPSSTLCSLSPIWQTALSRVTYKSLYPMNINTR